MTAIARVFTFCMVCGLSFLMGCSPPSKNLPHDVYIWQRQWTPALLDSLQQAKPLVRNWRILAAELDRNGNWFDASPVWQALQDKPVTLVVRIEGQLPDWDEASLIKHILQVAQRWHEQGVPVQAIEIDHDCSTSRLPDYSHFLQTLRPLLVQQFPGFQILSITALPTWLDSPALDKLLVQTDEAVLQVHAVMAPSRGLFSETYAKRWMQAFEKRTTKPWRVALPAYGTRVAWDDKGRVVSVESEKPMLSTGVVADELLASPQHLADFVHVVQQKPPAHLAGFVWFRLPTQNDARAWSPATWRAVISGQELKAQLEVQLRPVPNSTSVDLNDVVLVNAGDADTRLPQRVMSDTTCRLADGVNGYALDAQQSELMFYRIQDGLLRAGEERKIAWVNCSSAFYGKWVFYVEN